MALLRNDTSEDPGKRQAILDEAIRTFAEDGYRGTDVQVIADRAGVGKGTVYRYFRSKEDLFWAATGEVLERLEQYSFSAIEKVTGACEKIRTAALAHAEFFQSNPCYLELFIQERAEFRTHPPDVHQQQHERMLDHMAEIFQQGVDSGELPPLDVRQTLHAFGSLLCGTTMFAGRVVAVDLRAMTESAVDIFLRGILHGAGNVASLENADA